ncbi:MAG: hypothetical protein GWN58_12640, partial [Anaerolineae bacterium]|nr:hypothetical protein [Anaerolineae bacterium]
VAASVAVLLASRIIVRSTGLSPSWFDGLVLVGGSAYLGSQPESWPAAGALVLAVYLDNVLYPSGPTRSLYTAVLMTVATVGAGLAWADPGSWESPTAGEWIGAGAVLIGLLAAVVMVRPPTSRGDFRKIQLTEGRVLAVRLLPGAVLVGGLIYPGGPIIPTLSPLWAGIIAIPAASWVRRRILKPM